MMTSINLVEGGDSGCGNGHVGFDDVFCVCSFLLDTGFSLRFHLKGSMRDFPGDVVITLLNCL